MTRFTDNESPKVKTCISSEIFSIFCYKNVEYATHVQVHEKTFINGLVQIKSETTYFK